LWRNGDTFGTKAVAVPATAGGQSPDASGTDASGLAATLAGAVGVDVRPFPRPKWEPLPAEGAVGVEFRVLIREDDLFAAQLRFSEHATIHEHPGANETIVVCLEGEGLTSVGGHVAPLREGQQARWPKNLPHRLWTEGTSMLTLMIERPGA
jgi:quercetin dioxygenase-like cupin family protein